MATANPLWGAPRIHGELRALGVDVSERTVSRLLERRSRPPSQTWRTFLANHLASAASMDFFTVPTVTGRVLFVLLVLSHQRRRIVHVNITAHPDDTAPRWLHRDRDRIYGATFQHRLVGMRIAEVVSAPGSPWQNPFVERVIGSIRRECLNHVIIINESHLRRILAAYILYYHRTRTHLGLQKDTADHRSASEMSVGTSVAIPQVGGLHHRYERRAA
jgi:putative transposase